MSLGVGNASHQQPAFLIVYGFLMLPKKYELHRDVAVNSVAVMCLVSGVANLILLTVIIKDPLKQLRTITAILLAFSSAANTCISLLLSFDAFSAWSDQILFPKLILYLNVCIVNLFFIGNLLHTINIYGTIVLPIRYNLLKPKVGTVLVPSLSLTWLLVICAFIIPPYTLPEKKLPLYIQALPTESCVFLAFSSVIFIVCYSRIFYTLNARKRQLVNSFRVKSSTRHGLKLMKQHYEIAKTLFVHVLVSVITAAPGSIVLMMFLHCGTCDLATLRLCALYAVPLIYLSMVFHPFLWMFRLNCYRKAFKICFSCDRQSQL